MHMSVNGPIWVCVTEEVSSSSGSIVYLLVADLTDQISRRSESISMLLLLLLLLRLGERTLLKFCLLFFPPLTINVWKELIHIKQVLRKLFLISRQRQRRLQKEAGGIWSVNDTASAATWSKGPLFLLCHSLYRHDAAGDEEQQEEQQDDSK